MAWEKERLPPKLTTIGDRLIQEGVLYLFGRDKAYRPFIIVNAARMLEIDLETNLGLTKEELCSHVTSTCIFVMEWMKKNLFIPSKIENFNMIIDLYNVGITQAPFSLIKELLGIL